MRARSLSANASRRQRRRIIARCSLQHYALVASRRSPSLPASCHEVTSSHRTQRSLDRPRPCRRPGSRRSGPACELPSANAAPRRSRLDGSARSARLLLPRCAISDRRPPRRRPRRHPDARHRPADAPIAAGSPSATPRRSRSTQWRVHRLACCIGCPPPARSTPETALRNPPRPQTGGEWRFWRRPPRPMKPAPHSRRRGNFTSPRSDMSQECRRRVRSGAT